MSVIISFHFLFAVIRRIKLHIISNCFLEFIMWYTQWLSISFQQQKWPIMSPSHRLEITYTIYYQRSMLSYFELIWRQCELYWLQWLIFNIPKWINDITEGDSVKICGTMIGAIQQLCHTWRGRGSDGVWQSVTGEGREFCNMWCHACEKII